MIGAGIFLLFLIIGLIAFCIRRNRIRRAANQNMVVIKGGTSPSYNI